MRKFKKVEDKGHMGKFDDQTELTMPNGKKVGIDNPLVEEIQYLWSKGVETMGSCSGHKIAPPIIFVAKESIPKMVELSYHLFINTCGGDNWGRYDAFYSKAVEITDVMRKNHVNDILERINNK